VDFEPLKEFLRPYYLKWFYFRLFPKKRPDYLAACWNRPHFPANHPLDQLIHSNPGQPDLLFLPMSDWHSRIQRTQHLATHFGELGARCFYVNPHLGREFPTLYSPQDNLRIGLAALQVLELHIHLPREPVYHHRLLTADETGRIIDGIRRVTASAGAARVIQVVSFPIWLDSAVRLKRELGFPIVYDCHDLLSGFRAIAGPLLEAEGALLSHADLVCFSSQELLERAVGKRPAIAAKSIVIRNAANPIDYASARPPNNGAAPTIGYAGSLDFWFDREAIRQAAERHPDWKFVLLGRVESADVLQLRSLPNVKMEGEVPYSELPARMSGFNVAVIPFLKMPLTLATNPLKLYEYFSLGAPVVATRLPEIELFGELVYLYDTPEEFTLQLERAAAEDSPDLRSRRRTAASENTWRARCEQLLPKLAAL
jgi:glycosyltransferase involved in cell wall biosynthesis